MSHVLFGLFFALRFIHYTYEHLYNCHKVQPNNYHISKYIVRILAVSKLDIHMLRFLYHTMNKRSHFSPGFFLAFFNYLLSFLFIDLRRRLILPALNQHESVYRSSPLNQRLDRFVQQYVDATLDFQRLLSTELHHNIYILHP